MEKILKNQYEPVTINDLRGALKLILRKEIDNMPELLEQLTPKERLDFISRLMPFIFPKPDTISPTQGEPVSWDL